VTIEQLQIDKSLLEDLYKRSNHRKYVHPDPLEIVLRYDDIRDREIAALIASSLAYGRVAQILKSVSAVLDRMRSPADYVQNTTKRSLQKTFGNFKHRFTTGDELVAVILGIKAVILKYGSLEECFKAGMSSSDSDVIPALCRFVQAIRGADNGNYNSMLPSPPKGSACKRLNLFLKWMVRRDRVDPGGWTCVDSSKLIIPLDTHMFRIGTAFGMTTRKQANLVTAREITDAFRAISPDDPTKYDFALTRLGMEHGVGVVDHLQEHFMQTVGTHV